MCLHIHRHLDLCHHDPESVVPWFLGAFFLALVPKYLYRSKAITVPEMIRLNFGSGTLQAAGAALFLFSARERRGL